MAEVKRRIVKAELRLKAKALYLASQGTISITKLHQKVGIAYDTCRKWKEEDNWDQELRLFKSRVRVKLHDALGTDDKAVSVLQSIDPSELMPLVQSLVGPQVEDIVSQFLVKAYAKDLEHLMKLNMEIEEHLTSTQEQRDANPDKRILMGSDKIASLISSKTAIIKTLRLIFGLTTENGPLVPGGGTTINNQNNLFQIVLDSKQAESLKEINEYIGIGHQGSN
jgi:hypothetical protein